MPPSLQKACHPCAAAKRRCSPQLPQCSRCAQRGLTCTYDLEPVTNVTAPVARSGSRIFPDAWGSLPTALFTSVADAHRAAVECYDARRYEPLPVMANPDTLSLVTERHLKQMPVLTLRQRSTPYVHAQILLAGPCLARAGLGDSFLTSSTVIARVQRHVNSLNMKSLSFTEFLSAFHNLIAGLLAPILDAADQQLHIPGALLNLWPTWRQHLYAALPQTLDPGLSAWQAWYIAESARRSLLCVILVDGLLEVVEKGYCSYRPLVEALPFDARTGLWEADTEEQWLAALASHGGVQSSLMSWSEFIESGNLAPRKEHDGMLQRLLLVIHFGKAAAELQT
jgi:hypothetical protein